MSRKDRSSKTNLWKKINHAKTPSRIRCFTILTYVRRLQMLSKEEIATQNFATPSQKTLPLKYSFCVNSDTIPTLDRQRVIDPPKDHFSRRLDTSGKVGAYTLHSRNLPLNQSFKAKIAAVIVWPYMQSSVTRELSGIFPGKSPLDAKTLVTHPALEFTVVDLVWACDFCTFTRRTMSITFRYCSLKKMSL